MQTRTDVIDPDRARALQETLGLPVTINAGDMLPPFFYQIYFWDPQPSEALGRDGHPKVGGLIPDMGLPRRMWAGGRVTFDTPLRAGVSAQRRTSVEASTRKQGRSGPLGFVTLRHEIWQDGRLCITDHQDLVYCNDADPDAPRPEAPQARTDEDVSQVVDFTTTTLFRYSALTFNGHKIHYERAYAQNTERYPGLVVHGPLLAQYLLLLAERELGEVGYFEFRATAPLMEGETATLCWKKDGTVWARGPDGRQCMIATAHSQKP